MFKEFQAACQFQALSRALECLSFNYIEISRVFKEVQGGVRNMIQ